ncbi:MAG: single-stranded-DNA-specific exonuclease RecJ [Myxococcales bacterium]|nr:single-stranded-DNA-specific exonuclease RecJ [Myxococcales bacterium]
MDQVAALREATGLSEAAATILALRGQGNPHGFAPEEWLAPRMEHFHDPLGMHNMEVALDRLKRALRDKQRIRVVTDYDVDGTTSSLILQAALRVMDPEVQLDYHIPNRFGEGYGFSQKAAEQAAADGVGLVVTADIGVRDHKAVAAANAGGVDVLICDHHLPKGASVPEGATVLCPPQEDCDYPNGSLAACGVSLKLAEALLAEHPKRDAILRSMLKLAAVGTVADMVPLNTLENRAIVTLGLAELNEGRHHAGLASLIGVSGLQAGSIRPIDLGFRLGPRINAAGRVADATLVVELLTTREHEQANELANRLDSLNTQRKDIQRRLVQDALTKIGEDPPPFVVLSGEESEGWHRGVVGIVAARVKDEVHRPTAIVSIQGDTAVGSVRSVPEVHAVRALDSASDLLVKYGGHPAAAGFTVPTADLDTLRERLQEHVQSLVDGEEMAPVREIDAEVTPQELTPELLRELARLGPFGMGNPEPTFVIRGVRPVKVEIKGKQGNLLKFRVPLGPEKSVEAVWWDRPDLLDTLREHTVDLLVNVGENVWRGNRRMQLEVRDATLSEEPPSEVPL